MKDSISTLLSSDLKNLCKPVYIIIFIILVITAPFGMVFAFTPALISALALYNASKNIDNIKKTPTFITEKYLCVIIIYFLPMLVITGATAAVGKLIWIDENLCSAKYVLCLSLSHLFIDLVFFSLLLPAALFRTREPKSLKELLFVSVLILTLPGIFLPMIVYPYDILTFVRPSAVGLTVFVISYFILRLIVGLSCSVNSSALMLCKDLLNTVRGGLYGICFAVSMLLSHVQYPLFYTLPHFAAFLVIMNTLYANKNPYAASCPKDQAVLEKYLFSVIIYLVFIIPSFALSFLKELKPSGVFSLSFIDRHFMTFAVVMTFISVMIPISICSMSRLLKILAFIISLVLYFPAVTALTDVDSIEMIKKCLIKLFDLKMSYFLDLRLTPISRVIYDHLSGYRILPVAVVLTASVLISLHLSRNNTDT